MLTLYAATGDHVARIDLDLDPLRATTTLVLPAVGAQVVAVDPADPRRVFAGTFDDGIFRSVDGGATWENRTANLPTRRLSAIMVSDQEQANGVSVVYAGTEPSALYRSVDDGRTWHSFPAMLAVPSQPTWSFPPRPGTSHVRWIAQHPADPATLYVAIELGGVLVSRDAGRTWEDHRATGQADAHALATHPRATDRVYAAAGGGVARSNDAVRTWERLDTGLRHRYAWGLAVDAGNPDLWYVSAGSGPRTLHSMAGNSDAVLYRRRGEAPWQPISGPDAFAPYVLIAPPDMPQALIVGMHDGELRFTANTGDSWQCAPTGFDRIISLVLAPAVS